MHAGLLQAKPCYAIKCMVFTVNPLFRVVIQQHICRYNGRIYKRLQYFNKNIAKNMSKR